ncbi:hypothetical protein F4777DRAFT_562054 [Nemania sp. FL0916]|nr:hypothetical protein F4777DRAFT_562054 [Nemania sp. FL0916]
MDKKGTESHSLQISGRAVNVAQRDISIDQQHIEQSQEHNASATNQITVNFPPLSENAVLQQRMVPIDPSAAFIKLFLRELDPRGNVGYDDRLVDFAHADESENVTQHISLLWGDTRLVIEDLARSVEKFRSQALNGELYGGDAFRVPCESFTDTRGRINRALYRARNEANSVGTSPTRLIGALVDIETHIEPFFRWVCMLPGEDHRCGLCNSLSCLTVAIIKGVYIDPNIMVTISEAISAFNNVQEYIWLYDRRGMSIQLHELTIDTFKDLAVLAKTLLEYAWQGNKLSETQYENVTEHLAVFKSRLIDMNIDSKSIMNPARRKKYNLGGEDMRLEIHRDWKRFLDSTPRHLVRTTRPKSQKLKAPCTSKLQKQLSFDPRKFNRHVEELALAGNVEEKQLDQLSSLKRRDEFKSWLEDRCKATALLIHGNFHSSGAISPLTFLCAGFRKELHEGSIGNIAFLQYFCSTQPQGQRLQQVSAYDIVRSFTGQLITHEQLAQHLDFTFIDEKTIQRIRSGKFADMCRVFLRLLIQLNDIDTIVFCCIDSISICETKKLHGDTERLLSSLNKAVRARQDRY